MVIRSRKSKKDREYNGQKEKGQTMIYKTLHRKIKIEQRELHLFDIWFYNCSDSVVVFFILFIQEIQVLLTFRTFQM